MKNLIFFFFFATMTLNQATAQSLGGALVGIGNPFKRDAKAEVQQVPLHCEARCLLSSYTGPGKNLGDYRDGYDREAIGHATVYYPAYYNQSPIQDIPQQRQECWALAWNDLYTNVQSMHGQEAASWCKKNLYGNWTRYRDEVMPYQF